MENIKKIKKMAEYCLDCKNKNCQKGCPLDNDIPGFIRCIKQEKWQEAYDVLSETTVLSAICGRVCPHERQCEGHCVRAIKQEPVQIGKLEGFIGELVNKGEIRQARYHAKKEKKVAIVGGGPAGLTAAVFLVREGYQVKIFEKEEFLGGVLRYGIPQFRLPVEIVEKTVQGILDQGVEVENNMMLGRDITIEKLKTEFDAVFLALGANTATKMQIEGEDLSNVYSANELLKYGNHPKYVGCNVAVIGGGNVAMDIARTVKRLGAYNVTVIYRRSSEEMPADKKEIKDATQDGVQLLFQTNIVKVLGNSKVEKIECIKTELEKTEGDTRLPPVNIER